ncbi:LacI family DNA-binding transcriptional regulator [Paenibacillus sp. HWE-109]|uniref:LacI family DNA-binding transcriptional regulator n=1 Tax=Paenibacillus sp. HWE-109 TaxID=1306526 RepID=UPI001EDD1E44|nr:LacI family DNA-binding transcriptional regulator [Paenibacillus sp. HWE-109]UKS26789.1 LacI family DNA-binding transcriptional regulator [Paenibacillus sp. HWE-109]
MSQKITMQEIADRLSVSKYVVSKALSGKSGVSEATRQRVMQMAGQLGYLAQKKTPAPPTDSDKRWGTQGLEEGIGTVLVLMPNIRHQTKESTYWGKILDGISKELENRGADMLTLTLNSAEGLNSSLRPQGLAGVIGVGEISRSLLLEVQRLGLPLVLLDHDDPFISADQVFANNRDSAYRIVQYLLGLEHRSVQFIGNTAFSKSFRERWHGFREALEEAGIAYSPEPFQKLLHLEYLDAHIQEEQIREALRPHLERTTLPSALVCANDRVAFAAVAALRSLGVSVPDEVSVTGFDNIEPDYPGVQELTTVNVTKETIGKRGVDVLFWRIANRDSPAETIQIRGDLIVRKSAVTPRIHNLPPM